ncbi:hypothetical protein [Chroococcidiopsis sp. CCMEE 29]|nr:hypothetical protein [Chroococcidiopsis sp. CCMEE 29]
MKVGDQAYGGGDGFVISPLTGLGRRRCGGSSLLLKRSNSWQQRN